MNAVRCGAAEGRSESWRQHQHFNSPLTVCCEHGWALAFPTNCANEVRAIVVTILAI